jgi:plastocyanin
MLRLSAAFSACLLASLAVGCTREGPAYAPKSADVAAVVEMTNTFAFSPETIRIPVGSTVEWRQHLDRNPHRHSRPLQDP